MKKPAIDVSAAVRDKHLIAAGLKQAFQDAVREHYIAGVPMVFSENGKIVHIPAEQVAAEQNITLPTFPKPRRKNRKRAA